MRLAKSGEVTAWELANQNHQLIQRDVSTLREATTAGLELR
jgi:hypothetical protein